MRNRLGETANLYTSEPSFIQDASAQQELPSLNETASYVCVSTNSTGGGAANHNEILLTA